MDNLANPRDSTPATDDQRQALGDAYRILGGMPKARRSLSARPVNVDQLVAAGVDGSLLSWLLFQGHLQHVHEAVGRRALACAPS